jgi:chromosome segregation ATPase
MKSDSNYFEKTEENEVQKLQFIISKYNIILNEYQLKYGNELFATLEKKLNKEMLQGSSNEFKKILIENISLIKEYEKLLIEKDKHLNYYNDELVRNQCEVERLVKENDEIRDELEGLKDEFNKLYRNILDPEQLPNERNDMDIKLNTDYLREENEKLLGMLERSQFEEKQLKNILSELKDRYSELVDENKRLNEEYLKYKSEYDQYKSTKSFVGEKMKENCNRLILNERKMNEVLSNTERIEIENRYLKQEVIQIKDALTELENRKNLEIDLLMRDIQNCRMKENELKERLNINKAELSSMRFDNNKMKQELHVKTMDNDQLNKMIEDTNFHSRSIEEKEKYIDTTVKSHKRKADEAVLEKEKAIVKVKLLEKQISKINEDYSKNLKDKQNNYEQVFESSKSKYEHLISLKNEEMTQLRSDNLSLKMERDKYLNDTNTMKKEYDKLFSNYREDNDKYIKMFEESEKNSFKNQGFLQDKINALSRKLEQIEYDRNILEQELMIFKTNEKTNDQALERINRNDEFLEKEIMRYKEKVDLVIVERDSLQKDIERKTTLYENKIKQMKEQYELKNSILENSIKYQKDQFMATEDKAMIMLKKQENVNLLI